MSVNGSTPKIVAHMKRLNASFHGECSICGKSCKNVRTHIYHAHTEKGIELNKRIVKLMHASNVGRKYPQIRPCNICGKVVKKLGAHKYLAHGGQSLEVRRRNGLKNGKKLAQWCDERPSIRKQGGMASIKRIRAARACLWEGVPFASNNERRVAQILFPIFNQMPIEGENCHIQMDGGEVDFLLQDTFIEYHPIPSFYNSIETDDEYFTRRKALLDKNGFSNRLIVIKSIRKLEKMRKEEILQLIKETST